MQITREINSSPIMDDSPLNNGRYYDERRLDGWGGEDEEEPDEDWRGGNTEQDF